MIPLHSTTPIGKQLPPDYFSPGTYTLNGKTLGSPWAIAYYDGQSFRYERAAFGAPWVRVGNLPRWTQNSSPIPLTPIWIPQTFPAPVPDYTPEEIAKMEAAEEKRKKRENRT